MIFILSGTGLELCCYFFLLNHLRLLQRHGPRTKVHKYPPAQAKKRDKGDRYGKWYIGEKGSCIMFRPKEHYQQHATPLWKITRNCKGMYWWFIQPTIGQNCTYQSDLGRVHRGTQNTSIIISERKTHTIQALNCTEGYCFFTLVVTSFKGLPTFKDGISMDQLQKYGKSKTKIYGINSDAIFW